jgi:lipid II:glycine glycyltransferase (peptidoglycan interpeptide bridge formation enzyme)
VNWTLRVEDGLTAVERGLSANFRRNLRRALRENITICRGAGKDYLRRFYRMHLLTRRRFGLPAQPWRFFKLLGEIFASSTDLDIWVARRGGRDVTSVVLLSAGDKVYYKWGARRPGDDSRANHLLLWNAIEDHSSRADLIDLGRSDTSNHGLMRFKKELGAAAASLPYSYYPQIPNQVSAEALDSAHKSVAAVWSHLPIFATRLLGRAVYRYLA